MTQLTAGAARRKLEPPAGIAMLGYGRRTGRAAGVHDDLAVQALVLSDSVHKAAVGGVDLLALGSRIADDVCARVAAHSDIGADAIMVCATHTHSGPAFNVHATPAAGTTGGDDRDREWERALPGKIADTIIAANAALEPAFLKAAAARFTLGVNRRMLTPGGEIRLMANHAGVADGEANILAAYRAADSSPLAFVLNYPCHGVVLCEDNLLYSRDWMGFAMDEIERLGASGARRPLSIFLNGATGNIDPRIRGDFATAREWGVQMARAGFDALAAAAPMKGCEVAARSVPLHLRLKDLGAALAGARAYLEQAELSLASHRGGEFQLKRLRDHREHARAALAELEALDAANRRDRRVDLQSLELGTRLTMIAAGDAVLTGIPGEPFVEFGLALKANPWFGHTLPVGYCNDLIGYIPTGEAYAAGGYEVSTARVAAGSGELITAAALTAMREMHAAMAAVRAA